MKTFYEEIDKHSRKMMVAFLKDHFRYNTMNSWNACTSYANNVKLYNLKLTKEIDDKAYEIIQQDEFQEAVRDLIDDWTAEYNWNWTAGFNGRLAGYLVLYQARLEETGHKSYCPRCGQRNFQVAQEGSKCGVCGNPRVNFKTPPKRLVTYPGKGTDMYEDFEDWDMYSLKERVELIQNFDRLCDTILAELVYYCENYEVVEEKILVPTKVKNLYPVEARA